jgi:hypothetical protein
MQYALMVVVLHVCIRLVGYLLHDHLDIWWFHGDSCLWAVVLWMFFNLRKWFPLFYWQYGFVLWFYRTPKRTITMCLPCEPSRNNGFVWACCLMCGFSFSFLLKLMALRLVYLPHHHVFSVILMFCFYYDSLCGFEIGLVMMLKIWNKCYCLRFLFFLY